MANYELKNDSIDTITILAQNVSGTFDPLPAGDTFTIQNSAPASLNAVVGVDANGVPALVVNALVPLATGISVTISDADGLNSVTQLFDIVADVQPDTLVLNVAGATHKPQAVPVAPTSTAPAAG